MILFYPCENKVELYILVMVYEVNTAGLPNVSKTIEIFRHQPYVGWDDLAIQ